MRRHGIRAPEILLKTNICDEQVCSTETSGTMLIHKLPSLSLFRGMRIERVERASA